ncbi:Ger(x)C family spore germination C-terminal domain-containing protein [Desulfosporosinus metallidurans]|uniref:Ger(x)C family spore germination C-terminal domain-containing protein n=1 Tax=Desulfosporosinus metallidurans TaxID=1888891 RepID=UPI001F386008|nr:Ger(x)C family spore germination C-terminal domain-containing protein [Desulfosporosinus metallidurans]
MKFPDGESKKVALEIIRASSKVTPELAEGKPTVTVEVTEEGNLAEQMSSVDLTKPETLRNSKKNRPLSSRTRSLPRWR